MDASEDGAVGFAVLAAFWMVQGSHAKVMSLAPAVVELLLSTPTPAELADGVRICLTLARTRDDLP